jgi:hypothetical protein
MDWLSELTFAFVDHGLGQPGIRSSPESVVLAGAGVGAMAGRASTLPQENAEVVGAMIFGCSE